MVIFKKNGWFITLPDYSQNDGDQQSKKYGKGKVWSNQNYGADKKRQRKQNEREMLEARIVQLESVLRNQHGLDDIHYYANEWSSHQQVKSIYLKSTIYEICEMLLHSLTKKT